jgi:hypothetical protein
MNLFSVQVFDRSFNPAPNPFALTVQPYAGIALGGYDTAAIIVSGDRQQLRQLKNWLRYYVIIRNPNSNRVWAGIVTEATYPKGVKKITYSLDEMYNRIAVAYSEEDADGNTISGATAYADDLESQAKYGIKEMLHSNGDIDAAQAEALRDEALRTKKKPVRTIEMYGGEQEPEGRLFCRGLWSTFAWRIFNQPGGVVRHDVTGGAEHLLGWGVVASATVGFSEAGGEHRLHRLFGGLEALRKDDVVIVSGAANGANNGTFTITQATSHDAESITSTAIWFDPVDDINLTAGGLGFIQNYELLFLTVTGGVESWHNRYYFVHDETGDTHITVRPAIIGTQVAGPSVTIQQGHSIALSPATLVHEFPGASVTITALGTAISQAFTLAVSTPFAVAEVYVRLKRVGNPSDSAWAGIQADSAGVPSNINLEAISVLGSTLSDQTQRWVKFTFSNTTALTFGTTYWLVVGRTGANSNTDYYLVDLDEDAGYSGGGLKLWNGTAWVDRAVAADMPFQIWAKRQTTDQISDMYTAANQFCVALDVQIASGRYSRQYRDGDLDARQEMETLLNAGKSGGRRLLAQVSADRVLRIYEEPAFVEGTTQIFTDDGDLVDASGQPSEPGVLPAGRWIALPDEPPDEAGVLIEKAEYDAAQGRYTQLMPKGAVDPFDVVRLI